MKKLKIINLRNVSENDSKRYPVRKTARGVLLDNKNRVGVIYVPRYDTYQLVGGGVDDGESVEDGLRRESREEAGVEIEIISELGLITEVVGETKTTQISYCYVSKIIGEKGKTDFTEGEKKCGFEIRWIEFEKLEKEIERTGFSSPEGEYMCIRTKKILKEYRRKFL